MAKAPAALKRSPKAPHLEAGKAAETRAERFLCTQGLRLRARNYRTRRGEIDLIMDDGDCLVFVEVRYRAPGARVRAAESITAAKQRRITAAAEHYRLTHPQLRERPCRFDVVAVSEELQWIASAFDA